MRQQAQSMLRMMCQCGPARSCMHVGDCCAGTRQTSDQAFLGQGMAHLAAGPLRARRAPSPRPAHMLARSRAPAAP